MAGDDSLGHCGLFQGLCGLVQVFLVPRGCPSGGVLAEKHGRTGSPWDVGISSDPAVAWELRFDALGEDSPPAPAGGADLRSSSSDEEDSPPVSRELRSDNQEEDLAPVARNSSAQHNGMAGGVEDDDDDDDDCVILDSDPHSTVAVEGEKEGRVGDGGSDDELQIVAAKGQDDQEEDLSPVSRNSSAHHNGMAGGVEDDEDDDDDCVILDSDPHSTVAVKGEKEGRVGDGGSDDELQIIAAKGQVACRDFPHSRHLCSNMPFGTTSHEKHCTMCYCFVCDAPAPCSYWGKALSVDDHCHATDKETKWKILRQAFMSKNLPASCPEEETVVYPTTMSLAHLFFSNQITLPDFVTQSQHTHTSVRASLNVVPTVNAPSEGSGTSNGRSAQVNRPVEPTISAPRAHPVAGAGRGTNNAQTARISHPLALTSTVPRVSSATIVQSGTSNGHSAQVTQRVEPTVSAPRPQPAAGSGRGTSNTQTAQICHQLGLTVSAPRASSATRVQGGTSNGHSAQVTRLVESTVSAPRPHPAAGAGRGSSNAHTALITRPVESTVSAARPYSAARTGRGTSNTQTSQITRPVEPTLSATRGYPAGRTGRGISNAHTAPVTFPVEQTVNAPRVYPAGRAGSDSSNAHSGQITYPTTATPDAPEGATVYVANIPYRIDSERLKLIFQQAGVVLFSKVIYDRETGHSRGFGFVTMSTVQEAETAVRIYNGYEVYGRSLTASIAAPRGGTPVDTTRRQSGSPLRIFVCNLPSQVDHSRLEELFSEHGKVVNARVVYESREGACCSRGFGFVTMATEEESYKAIHALNKQILEGHALVVKVATERPQQGQNAASQSQNTHTGGRASPNVAPTVNAPRAYPATRARSGTSNAYTAQVTRRVDLTRSN